MYDMTNKRRLKYATDPEYRQKELERVAKAKQKKDFIEWQRAYNREYYHRIRKEKMRNNPKGKETGGEKPVRNYRAKVPASSPIKFDDFESSGSDVEILEATTVKENRPETPPRPASPVIVPSTPTTSQTPIIVKTLHTSIPVRKQQFAANTSLDEMTKTVNTQAEICAILDIELEFKCKRCPMRFSGLEEATTHAKTHQTMHYECGVCKTHFTRLPLLIQHISREHGELAQEQETETIVESPISSPPPLIVPAKESVIKSVAQEVVKLTEMQKKDKAKKSLRQTEIKRQNMRDILAKKEREIVQAIKDTRRISPRTSARVGKTQKLLQKSIKEALEDFEEEGGSGSTREKNENPESVVDQSIVYSCPNCPVSFLDIKYYRQHLVDHAKEQGGSSKRESAAGKVNPATPRTSTRSDSHTEVVYVYSNEDDAAATETSGESFPVLEPSIKYVINDEGHLVPMNAQTPGDQRSQVGQIYDEDKKEVVYVKYAKQ